MSSVKVHCVVGFKQEQWLSEEVFENIKHIKPYNWTNMRSVKVQCVLGFKHKQWLSEEVIETLYSFKHTIEKRMRSLKVHWVVGFKQKQWFSEEVFQNIIHIQTYNWTKYALCESTVSGGLQAEAMGFRRSFSKHFFTFKHTIEQNMRDVEVHWVVGFKQKQCFSEEVFQNVIHIQTYNWTKYAICESTLSGGLQAETIAFRRNFFKHYTLSIIQLNKVCALWRYTDWWASSRSNSFQKNYFETLYTFNYTIEQSMRSVKVHSVVGFKQKQWLAE